ncbi:MAG: sulfatase-like hydrolase/transferase [Candidatus Solibacter usitatus]|nr:sulfatase-like hydrolase/transferase [Candidatus Solibacter usitatus]
MTRRAVLGTLGGAAVAQTRRPNIVLIVTDNHGAWSLGCYGNADIRTPNIDRLAKEGVLFTRAFAVNAVCSPTRASLLTGLMPSQHGVHRYLAANGAQVGPRSYYTLEEFETLPKILTANGYSAGLTGKWHLGNNLRPLPGFSHWVTMPHGNTAGFYDQQVIEDGRIRTQPGYLTDYWSGQAVKFIEQNRSKPFFLYLPFNGPYGLGSAMKEPSRNRHAAYYADKELASMPRDAPHPWNFNYGSWMNDMAVRRKYAAEISAVDDGVGQVMDALDRNGLRDNTLVVFLGDQGMAGGHSGFWGMGDHTRPLTAFDWNMWIPLIVSHRGRIPAGRKAEQMVNTCDVMPSLLDYLGLAEKQARRPISPGRSFASILNGEKATPWENIVFYEFENVRAVRTPEWKYVERIHESPNELYHLTNDPGERLNLYYLPGNESIKTELKRRLDASFAKYAEPRWDLWKKGTSKSGLISGKLFGLEIQEGK